MSLREFRALLATGRRLRIKFGADVTAGFLHLGHAVNLWMMREMQERGHLVQFLIGDFTTRIGDPTGRSRARVPPTREAVERDAEAFIRQIGRVLVTDEPELFEVRRNSEWWDRKGVGDFLALAGELTAGRLLSRDMFRARQEAGGEVRLDEMLYPLLQGWDSVELESDLTIVGSDQLFNESIGRLFQERRGLHPQVIVTTRITPGLDGRVKQSKSLGNYIAISDPPREIFGKTMSLPDHCLRPWLEVYTLLSPAEVEELCDPSRGPGPRAAKLRLAEALVERWWGREAAAAESAWFQATFGRREFPPEAPTLELEGGSHGALELIALAGYGASRSERRRLVEQGGLRVDGVRIEDPEAAVALGPGETRELRIGKRGFFRIRGRG